MIPEGNLVVVVVAVVVVIVIVVVILVVVQLHYATSGRPPPAQTDSYASTQENLHDAKVQLHWKQTNKFNS